VPEIDIGQQPTKINGNVSSRGSHWSGDEMEANRWPLMRGGSERTGEMILAVVNKGLATVAEVVAATKLNPITVQNYLTNMPEYTWSEAIERSGGVRTILGVPHFADCSECLLVAHRVGSRRCINSVAIGGEADMRPLRAAY
jgi:hypothetical protein